MGNLLQTSEQINGAPPADPAAEAHRAALRAGEECRQAAHRYCDMGLSVTVLCPPDHVGVGKGHAENCASPGKSPLHKWKPCQTVEGRLSHADIDRIFKQHPNANVGICLGPASGLVRVDVDSVEGEWKLAELTGGDLPSTLEFTSGGGRGLLFKIPPGVILKTTPFKAADKKESVRLQAEGAQTVLPPSRHKEGGRYAWVPGQGPGEIEPALMPPWLVELMKVQPHRNGGPHKGTAATSPAAAPAAIDRAEIFRRAGAYVAKMPPAISGQGGHNQTFRVACVLILGVGLTVDEALPLIQEYNQRCQPSWTDAELLHKLTDADKQDGERGYLLRDDPHRTDWGMLVDMANDARIVTWQCQNCRWVFDDAVRERIEQVRLAREKRSKELAEQNAAVTAKIGQRPHATGLGFGRLAPAPPVSPAIPAGPPAFGFHVP